MVEKNNKKEKQDKKASQKAAAGGGRGWLAGASCVAMAAICVYLGGQLSTLRSQLAKDREAHMQHMQQVEDQLTSARREATVSESQRLDALSHSTTLQNQLTQQKSALSES